MIDTYEVLISQILDIFEEYSEKMVHGMSEKYQRTKIDEISAIEWTIEELSERILNHPEKDPYEILDYFIMEMTHFMAISNEPDACTMFQIARDTAEELKLLVDMVICGENQ